MAAAASTLDRCRFVGRTVDARDRRLGDAGAEVDGNSGQSAAATLPPEFVLVFGGAGSLLVAVVYVPAAGALDRRGQALSTELFPLNEADEASAVLSVADNRNKLEQLLGIGMAPLRTCRRAWPSSARFFRAQPPYSYLPGSAPGARSGFGCVGVVDSIGPKQLAQGLSP